MNVSAAETLRLYRALSRSGACLSQPAKLVLLNICERTGKKAIAYPSQEQIAADTGYSVRTVRDAIGELDKLGLIKTHGAVRRGDNHTYEPLAAALRTWANSVLLSAKSAANQEPLTANSADDDEPTDGKDCRPHRQDLPPTPAESAAPNVRDSIEGIQSKALDDDLSGWPPEIMSRDWFPDFIEILSWYPPSLRNRPDNAQPAEILAKTYPIESIREKRKTIMGEPHFLKGWPQEILDAFGRDYEPPLSPEDRERIRQATIAAATAAPPLPRGRFAVTSERG